MKLILVNRMEWKLLFPLKKGTLLGILSSEFFDDVDNVSIIPNCLVSHIQMGLQ